MNIISKKIEEVFFSRIVKDNESERLCEIPYEIIKINAFGFLSEGFASEEYPKQIECDVVCVQGRYFKVSRATSNMRDYWNSVTLPPGLDPRPSPREWEAYSSEGYLYDPRVTGNPNKEKTFKVREIIKKP